MTQNNAPKGLAQHPLSAAFPPMAPMEFADLVNDIRANGIQQPVTLFEGMVLDGWHRYRASGQLGCPCPAVDFEGADPRRFVLSLNLNRRHLNASQRAEAVVACNAWVPSGANQYTKGGGEAAAPPLTNEEMAEEAGTSKRTIQQAKKAHAAGLGEAVKAGKVSVERAAQIAELPEHEREAALEAPAAPKARAKAGADMEALQARIAELENQVHELVTTLQHSEEDSQSMARVIESEDRVAAAMAEAKRFREHARVVEERNRGLMSQVAELTKSAKSWMKKFQALERQTKAASDAA